MGRSGGDPCEAEDVRMPADSALITTIIDPETTIALNKPPINESPERPEVSFLQLRIPLRKYCEIENSYLSLYYITQSNCPIRVQFDLKRILLNLKSVQFPLKKVQMH